MGKPLSTRRLGEVTPDVLEVFQAERPLVAGNRNLALLRAMCVSSFAIEPWVFHAAHTRGDCVVSR